MKKHLNNIFIIILPLLIFLVQVIITRIPSLQVSALGYFFPLILGILFLISIFSPITLGYRLYKKQKIDIFTKYGLSFLIALTTFAIIYGKIVRYYPVPLPYGSDRSKFDRNLWLANANESNQDLYPRQQMLKDVVQKLPGKNKQEVIELLGEGLDTGYFSGSERDLIYYLGYERKFVSIDSEWLLIWFDENERYDSYEIAND